MTKNKRVLAVRLSDSETSALEVQRWLDKWGISSTISKETYQTNIVLEYFTAQPGHWIVVDGAERVWVFSNSDFHNRYDVKS